MRKLDDFYQAILTGWKVMHNKHAYSIYPLGATHYTLVEVAKQ